MMRGWVVGLLLLAGCAVVTPPPVVSPDPAHLEAVVRDCSALWADELGREIDPVASADCGLTVAEGRRTIEDYRALLRASDEYALYQKQLEAQRQPVVTARRGLVSLADRVFVDDGGPWLAAGTSCFWCGWGTVHDRARTEGNLATVAGRFDFIRVLGVVGPCCGWSDRTVTAADIHGTNLVADTTDLAYASGLRVQWTIFGGIDTTPTPDSRRALVHRFVEQLAPRREKVQLVEIANEGWQNGFPDDAGRDELIALANIVRASLPGVPVALTAPRTVDVAAYYRGSSATIATVHTERDVRGTGGFFRPIRQAREYVDQGPWINNEPIGPQSSVAADDDPDRIALAAAYTWLSKGAAYVYHTGAGIRGGGQADRDRGRAANFSEVAHFDAVADRLAALRSILPADLPNWAWLNSNDRFPAYPFALPYEVDGTKLIAPEDELLRAFASFGPDGRFIVIPIAVTKSVRFTAKRPMAFDVHDIASLRTVSAAVTLAAGQTFTLAPTPGAVFVGRFQ